MVKACFFSETLHPIDFLSGEPNNGIQGYNNNIILEGCAFMW